MAQIVKNLPAMQETRFRSLGQEDPLEKEMATHSSVLAWRIPWTEEPGRLQSMGSQRVSHDLATSLSFLSFFSVIVLIGSDAEGNCMPIAAAKSLQLCLTQCGPIDGRPPGSVVPGILQARTLEWVAIHFLLQCVKVKSLSRVQHLVTPWTTAYQAPPSM